MNSNSQEEENLLLDFFEKIDKDIDVESNIRAVLSYSQNYSKFISKNGIKSIINVLSGVDNDSDELCINVFHIIQNLLNTNEPDCFINASSILHFDVIVSVLFKHFNTKIKQIKVEILNILVNFSRLQPSLLQKICLDNNDQFLHFLHLLSKEDDEEIINQYLIFTPQLIRNDAVFQQLFALNLLDKILLLVKNKVCLSTSVLYSIIRNNKKVQTLFFDALNNFDIFEPIFTEKREFQTLDDETKELLNILINILSVTGNVFSYQEKLKENIDIISKYISNGQMEYVHLFSLMVKNDKEIKIGLNSNTSLLSKILFHSTNPSYYNNVPEANSIYFDFLQNYFEENNEGSSIFAKLIINSNYPYSSSLINAATLTILSNPNNKQIYIAKGSNFNSSMIEYFVSHFMLVDIVPYFIALLWKSKDAVNHFVGNSMQPLNVLELYIKTEQNELQKQLLFLQKIINQEIIPDDRASNHLDENEFFSYFAKDNRTSNSFQQQVEENNKLKNEISLLKENFEIQKQEMNQLRDKMKLNELNSIKQLKNLRNECDDKEERITELESENSKIKSQIQSSNTDSANINIIKEKNDIIEKLNAQVLDDKEKLMKLENYYKNEVEVKESVIKDLEKKILTTQESQNLDLYNKISNLENNLLNSSMTNQHLEEQIETLKNVIINKSKLFKNLSSENLELSQKIVGFSVKERQLEIKNMHLIEANKNLEENLNNLCLQVSNKTNELDAIKLENIKLKKDIDSLSVQLSSFKNKNSNSNKSITNQEKDIKDLLQKFRDLQNENGIIIQKKVEEITDLKGKILALQFYMKKREDYFSSIENRLMSTLQKSTKKIIDRFSLLNQIKLNLSEKSESLSNLEIKIIQLQKFIKSKQNKINYITEIMKSSSANSSQFDELNNSKINEVELKSKQIEIENLQLKEKNKKLNEDNEILSTKVVSLSKKIKLLKLNLNELAETEKIDPENITLKNELSISKLENQKLQKQILFEKEEKERQMEHINSLLSQNKALIQQVTDLNTTLSQSTAPDLIKELRAEIRQLRKKNNELQSKISEIKENEILNQPSFENVNDSSTVASFISNKSNPDKYSLRNPASSPDSLNSSISNMNVKQTRNVSPLNLAKDKTLNDDVSTNTGNYISNHSKEFPTSSSTSRKERTMNNILPLSNPTPIPSMDEIMKLIDGLEPRTSDGKNEISFLVNGKDNPEPIMRMSYS